MSSFAPGTPESVINEFNNRMYGTPINPMAGINPVTGLQTNQSLGLFSNVLGSLGNSGTPIYDLLPQQSQGIANVNPGIRPTPEQDALIRQQMAQMGMSPNQPLNPYMSGTPSYGQMPQGSPLMYRPGIDQYQTAPNSQEFSNVSNVLGQMPQGISPYPLQSAQPIGQLVPQQSVQAPHMTAYDRLVQQRNQNLGNNFTPFGTVNRNNMPGFSRFPDYQQRGFGRVNATGPINPAIVNPIRNR